MKLQASGIDQGIDQDLIHEATLHCYGTIQAAVVPPTTRIMPCMSVRATF